MLTRRETLATIPGIAVGLLAASHPEMVPAATHEKPFTTKQRPIFRKEGQRWVRRRLSEFRQGDEIIVALENGDVLQGTLCNAPSVKDCGDKLDWGCRAMLEKLDAHQWAAIKQANKLSTQ